MANQPKRRPISIPAKTIEDVQNQKKEHELQQQQKLDVEQDIEQPVQETPQQDNVPVDDEQWEKLIEQKKNEAVEKAVKYKEQTVTQVRADDEPQPQEVTEAKQYASTILQKNENDVDIPAPKKENLPEIEVADNTETPSASNVTDPEELNRISIAQKNNASSYVHTTIGSDEDRQAAIEREFEEDSRPDSVKNDDPTPYERSIAVDYQLGQKTNNQRLQQRFINYFMEKNTHALQEVTNELRMARITPKIGDGSGPKKLSGATARAAVVSRIKGMYRVQLYNSGFWLDLRPPTLIDIDGWMQQVDTEFQEIGRILGGYAHAVVDVFLKQKLCEILPQMIQRSNFKDWEDSTKLVSNISYHDYNTILWAFCCMMYRDGVGIGIYCTNPDCRYIDNQQYVDLRNVCFINTELFPSKALEWMKTNAHNNTVTLTEDDLKQYRNTLLHFEKVITCNNNTISYHLKVPVMREFIADSSNLVGKISAITNGEKNIKNDLVSNQLTYHLYKMLLPWIDWMTINDETGNVIYKIEDKEAIYESLDINQFEGTSFYHDVSDFIRDTQLSIYAAMTLKCPKCGKVADIAHDNMFALDLQYLFFCLSCLQLQQTGASF